MSAESFAASLAIIGVVIICGHAVLVLGDVRSIRLKKRDFTRGRH